MSATQEKTRTLTGLGILTAITIVLELFAGFVGLRFGPFNITLSLAPMIIGAALYGPKASAWLGFVFSFIVLFEPSTALFMSISAPATILVVLVKGTAAGLVGGLVFRLVSKKSTYAAAITAGIVMPLVNTGLFLLGTILFFLEPVRQLGVESGYTNVYAFLIFGMVGLNFIVETAINLCLGAVIVRVIETVRFNHRSTTAAS